MLAPLRAKAASAALVRTRATRAQLRCMSTKFDQHTFKTVPAKKQKYIPTSGTYPKGFQVGSIHAGIKPEQSQLDLVLVASEAPSCGAAVFTKNEFASASVVLSRDILGQTKGRGLRGVIANSGCGNTFTGEEGIQDAAAMGTEASRFVSSGESRGEDPSVMIMQTGAGGVRLPLAKVLPQISKLYESLGSSHSHWLAAATGLCTTDTFPKLASRTFTLPSFPDTTFSLAGITKGAGMIHPNMATTLGIVCTDAPVTPQALQRLLSVAANKSYNCISIEGDTSTNDMVAMFANGAAARDRAADAIVDFRTSGSPSQQSPDFLALQRILVEFMSDMAKLVVRDGEGASKFITIRVRGSPSYDAAKLIASAIARSVLLKAGIYGKNPNWGCIVVALGYALVDTPFAKAGIVVPKPTSVSFVEEGTESSLTFYERGVPVKVDEPRVKELMTREDIEIIVDLRDDGNESKVEESVYWTCDLTHDFVTINSDFGN
ncbi:Arginine biosynthesis bifunctional protein ArgJ 2 beta chain [Thozetella sp. PMI_491]|nr:Arginine biosynthesis bifunctional protein ArgJ 2 beta chain [Thozetella sp. PMI_491]